MCACVYPCSYSADPDSGFLMVTSMEIFSLEGYQNLFSRELQWGAVVADFPQFPFHFSCFCWSLNII